MSGRPFASSPRVLRRTKIVCDRFASSTKLSGHTTFISSCLSTTRSRGSIDVRQSLIDAARDEVRSGDHQLVGSAWSRPKDVVEAGNAAFVASHERNRCQDELILQGSLRFRDPPYVLFRFVRAAGIDKR